MRAGKKMSSFCDLLGMIRLLSVLYGGGISRGTYHGREMSLSSVSYGDENTTRRGKLKRAVRILELGHLWYEEVKPFS